jgi:hypothetical protein
MVPKYAAGSGFGYMSASGLAKIALFTKCQPIPPYYTGIGSNFPDSERTTPLKIAFMTFLML